MKLCECGCGQPAPIGKETRKNRGLVKGQPLRFVSGHNPKTKGKDSHLWKGGRYKGAGYTYLLQPDHPRANKDGYVPEQYIIVEKIIGKTLPITAVVHHGDGKRSDNHPSNLVVCENKAYHSLLHIREKAFKACGHASWRKCKYCKEYDDPIKLHLPRHGHSYYHKSCCNTYLENWKTTRLILADPTSSVPERLSHRLSCVLPPSTEEHKVQGSGDNRPPQRTPN